MCTEYDKPFKNYDELLDLLDNRNVIIDDREFAKLCLSNYSYYTLINGYKDLYKYDEEDKFLNPVPFNEFVFLHYFDISINNIIFKYIIEVERSLKSKLSYIISKNYGVYTDYDDFTNMNPTDYLYRNNYAKRRKRNNVLKSIKEEIEMEKDHKKNNVSVQHYLKNHNHLPCWILTNCITFGLMIQWYNILKVKEKNYVCNSFFGNETDLTLEEKKEFLKKGLDILKNYRNNIAHGNKVFTNTIRENLPKKQTIILSKNQITDEDYKCGIGVNDLFAVIIIIYTLLDNNFSLSFLDEIITLFSKFKKAPKLSTYKTLLEMLSLPDDFIEKLNNIRNSNIL